MIVGSFARRGCFGLCGEVLAMAVGYGFFTPTECFWLCGEAFCFPPLAHNIPTSANLLGGMIVTFLFGRHYGFENQPKGLKKLVQFFWATKRIPSYFAGYYHSYPLHNV